MIPEAHDIARKQMFPDDSVEDFLNRVCNQGAILPQDKISGGVFHMPAAWLACPEREVGQAAAINPFGWRNTKYLIVLPSVPAMDVNIRQPLSSRHRPGRFLREELRNAGIRPEDVMVTHALRFALPDHMTSYSSRHRSTCEEYLRLDIENCRPDVIITFGANSFKGIFGAKAKTSVHRGSLMEYTYSDGTTAVVVPTVSHLSFMVSTAGLDVFQQELRVAGEIGAGMYRPKTAVRDYTVCRTLPEVQALMQKIKEDGPTRIAFDTEWGNDVARSEFRYTLSIQLSWGVGKAACILLRTQIQPPDYVRVYATGKPRKRDGRAKVISREMSADLQCGIQIHTPEVEKEIWGTVAELLNDRRWKLVAHHLRVDVEQFAREGCPIDDRVEDGMDTMLAHHLLHGDEDQGLDDLVRKYAPEYGAYWAELEEWLGAKGSGLGKNKLGRSKALQYGYRNIPLEILTPYGLDDAAATWVVGQAVEAELAKNDKLNRLYWDHVAPTSLHLLDLQRHGILVDEERRMEIRELYEPVYEDLVRQIREELRWPDFNPGSSHDVRSALFSGIDYLEKKSAPEDALVYNIPPLSNTEKYPKLWTELERAGESHNHRPSTKANVLELLQQIHPDKLVIRLLKHASVLGKLLSTYLSPVTLNEHGVPVDGPGFHCNIGADGRVRTNLSQLTETGRYTSKRANLQTSPKKQESAVLEALIWHKFQITPAEYKRRTFDGVKDKVTGACLRPAYDGPDRIEVVDRVHTIPYKSIFVAREGYSLIEADFKTAELFIWAYCSGDAKLIAICDSGRDLHSEVACAAFKLPMLEEMYEVSAKLTAGDRAPYKAWNDRFKETYESERIAAKTVNFGIMYGRSAGALAREIQKQGVDITAEQCQVIIDGVASSYAVAWAWICDNAARAVEEEFIENAFGRCRYFTGASKMSRSDQAAVERAAKNSPIQGCVADLLARAGINLYRLQYRTKRGKALDFRIILPVHDAFLLEVRDDHVGIVKDVLQLCMSKLNTIPGTEYRLQLDIIVMKRWGGH